MERREANKISLQVPGYCPIRYTLHMELFGEHVHKSINQNQNTTF